MIIQVLHCPYCQGTDIVRHGKSPEGKQRYRCRECREGRGRTFLLDYSYAGVCCINRAEEAVVPCIPLLAHRVGQRTPQF